MLLGASVPIVRVPHQPIPHGSGTLIAIADDVFIVTAAHVLVENWKQDDPGPPMNLALGALREKRIIGLTGQAAWNKVFDVGVMRLSPECRDEVKQSLTPLRLSSVDLRPRPLAGALYVVHGWPLVLSRRSETKLGFEPFIMRLTPFTGSTETFRRFDSARQLALDYGRGDQLNDDGESVRGLDGLEGISGCGLWRLLEYGGSMSLWTGDQAKVVAVQTGVFQLGDGHEAIGGTTWRTVAELINTKFPDLRSALHLTVP